MTFNITDISISGLVTVEFSEEMRELFKEKPFLNVDILNEYKDLFLDLKYNDQEKKKKVVKVDDEVASPLNFFSNEDKDQELLDDDLHRNEFPGGIYNDTRYLKDHRKLNVKSGSMCDV